MYLRYIKFGVRFEFRALVENHNHGWEIIQRTQSLSNYNTNTQHKHPFAGNLLGFLFT